MLRQTFHKREVIETQISFLIGPNDVVCYDVTHFPAFCRSIGRHFKRSVDTLISISLLRFGNNHESVLVCNTKTHVPQWAQQVTICTIIYIQQCVEMKGQHMTCLKYRLFHYQCTIHCKCTKVLCSSLFCFHSTSVMSIMPTTTERCYSVFIVHCNCTSLINRMPFVIFILVVISL